MPINKNSLQARINNLANKTGVHQNILLKSFFFDAFLKNYFVGDVSFDKTVDVALLIVQMIF